MWTDCALCECILISLFLIHLFSRDFCALGDIDPDVILKHDPYAALHAARSTRRYVDDDPFYTYMWSSRAKDILVLSSNNPLEHDGYCHYFGIVV